MAPRRPRHPSHHSGPEPVAGTLRIIGGTLGGRPIAYRGDPRTRPMKQRVREAIFNLLGPRVVGTHVVDLFAGTGAVTWEALSRGAASAVLFEQHFPTARILQQNARELGLVQRIHVVAGDTFFWARKRVQDDVVLPPHVPWLIFCCPPYDLYVARREDLLELIQQLANHAPSGSLVVVEADERFPASELPALGPWDVRIYAPAVIALAPLDCPPQTES